MNKDVAIGIFCGIIVLILVLCIGIFVVFNLYVPGQGMGMMDIITGNEDSGYVIYKQKAG